jgi:hypothetical protein
MHQAIRALKISGRHFDNARDGRRREKGGSPVADDRKTCVNQVCYIMETFLIRRLRKSGLMERRLEKDQPDP